jgi:hypothetical protein
VEAMLARSTLPAEAPAQPGVSTAAIPARCRRAVVRHTSRMPPLRIAENNAADEPLARDPLALVLGVMLDPNLQPIDGSLDSLTMVPRR